MAKFLLCILKDLENKKLLHGEKKVLHATQDAPRTVLCFDQRRIFDSGVAKPPEKSDSSLVWQK